MPLGVEPWHGARMVHTITTRHGDLLLTPMGPDRVDLRSVTLITVQNAEFKLHAEARRGADGAWHVTEPMRMRSTSYDSRQPADWAWAGFVAAVERSIKAWAEENLNALLGWEAKRGRIAVLGRRAVTALWSGERSPAG